MELRINKVKDLRKIARKFAAGDLERIMIVGPPGQRQTETIKEALGQKGRLCLRGRTTATFYEELFDHCDMPGGVGLKGDGVSR